MHDPPRSPAPRVPWTAAAASLPARTRRESCSADRQHGGGSVTKSRWPEWSSSSTASTCADPFPVDFRVLAALRPRMLELGPQSFRRCAPVLRAGRPRGQGARDTRSDALIAVELRSSARRRSVDARATARRHTRDLYDPSELHEQPARVRLHRRRLNDAGSDRWSTRSWLWGPRHRRRTGRGMRAAGADHVCIQVSGTTTRSRARSGSSWRLPSSTPERSHFSRPRAPRDAPVARVPTEIRKPRAHPRRTYAVTYQRSKDMS